MKHYIPEAARKKHIAILGMNGSGKTSIAKAELIEPALLAGERVCNIDPTGVGWGLRLARDGKKTGFKIYIVGGERADFPLERRDGETWGDIVGTSADSFVFDTSLMTVQRRSEWFTDFAETLIRKNKGPLNFILDEAHLFAPQAGARAGGIAPAMLHATNNLLALGRSKGLRIAMISQRPAKLHKDSLTQAHTLIAMMMTAPQDRHAVEDWIADQADEAKGREIISSLATLAPGEGWLWAPREGVLERIKFPRPTTFDSSSAPDTAEGSTVVLPSIDPEAIKGKLANVAKEKTANDPVLLRAEIARLQKELKNIPQNISVVDPKAIEDAERRGFEQAEAALREMADKKLKESTLAYLEELSVRVAPIAAFVQGEIARVRAEPLAVPHPVFKPSGPSTRVHPPRVTPPERAASVPTRKPLPVTGSNGALGSGEQRIIDAIRWWNVLGIGVPSQAQVGFIAGYSHKSGTWATYLSRLRSANLIRRSDLVLTEEGLALAHEPDTPPSAEALRATVLSKIDAPLKRILSPIIDAYPDGLTQTNAGDLAGYSSGSGTWATYLSRLRSLDLIEGRGDLKAQEWLFP